MAAAALVLGLAGAPAAVAASAPPPPGQDASPPAEAPAASPDTATPPAGATLVSGARDAAGRVTAVLGVQDPGAGDGPQVEASAADGTTVPVTVRPLLSADAPPTLLLATDAAASPADVEASKAAATDLLLSLPADLPVRVVAPGEEPRLVAGPRTGRAAAVAAVAALAPAAGSTSDALGRVADTVAAADAEGRPAAVVIVGTAGAPAGAEAPALGDRLRSARVVPVVLGAAQDAGWGAFAERAGGLVVPPETGVVAALTGQYALDLGVVPGAGAVTVTVGTAGGASSFAIDLPAAAAPDPATPATLAGVDRWVLLAAAGAALLLAAVASALTRRARRHRPEGRVRPRRAAASAGHVRPHGARFRWARRLGRVPAVGAASAGGRVPQQSRSAAPSAHARRAGSRPGSHRRVGAL